MYGTTLAIEIRPWHQALYAEMRQPKTLRATKRLLRNTLRDLETAPIPYASSCAAA